MRSGYWILSFLFFIFFASAVYAEDADYVSRNLNRNFAGRIMHSGGKTGDDILVTLIRVQAGKNGDVIAEGTGEFFTEQSGSGVFEVVWKINPATLQFEMNEKNGPEGAGGRTSGVFVGNISKDLESIEAVSVSKDGQEVLTLYAVVNINR